MNMNVFKNNELVLSDVSSTELRNKLVQNARLPSKVAKMVIAMVMKQGTFNSGYLRVVAINHPKHHGRKHSLVRAA